MDTSVLSSSNELVWFECIFNANWIRRGCRRMVIVEKMQIGAGGGDIEFKAAKETAVEDHYEIISDDRSEEKPDTSKSSSKKKRYSWWFISSTYSTREYELVIIGVFFA